MSSWADAYVGIGHWANEKLAIDELQMRKCKLYMWYKGGPMNGVECSRR